MFVATLARDILDGRWQWTHQGAGLDVDGVLFDAHHRLRAIIKATDQRSEVSVEMNLAFGYPREAVSETDGGRSRSMADRLDENHRVVSAVRACMRAERGKVVSSSRAEVAEAIARHAPAIEALRTLMQQKCPASFWGTLVFAYPVAADTVVKFAEEVVKGAAPGSPAFTLREWLSKADTAGQDNQHEVSKRTLYALRATMWGSPLSKFAPKDTDAIFDWFRARLTGKPGR